MKVPGQTLGAGGGLPPKLFWPPPPPWLEYAGLGNGASFPTTYLYSEQNKDQNPVAKKILKSNLSMKKTMWGRKGSTSCFISFSSILSKSISCLTAGILITLSNRVNTSACERQFNRRHSCVSQRCSFKNESSVYIRMLSPSVVCWSVCVQNKVVRANKRRKKFRRAGRVGQPVVINYYYLYLFGSYLNVN